MREQIGYPYRQPGQPVIQRRSLTTKQEAQLRQQPASPHRAGHYAGLHDESAPFITGYDSDEDDDTSTKLPARTTPRSAIRYRPLNTTHQQAIPKRRKHWLVYVGLAMFIMLIGWVLITMIGYWWQTKMDDLKYGYPRTYQTDANVGHYGYTSHFVALNLNGKVEVIETQPQNPDQQKATHMYIAATLSIDQSLQPVTLKFEDLTGSGKLDMLVYVGSTLQVPFYNNGTSFQNQPPGK